MEPESQDCQAEPESLVDAADPIRANGRPSSNRRFSAVLFPLLGWTLRVVSVIAIVLLVWLAIRFLASDRFLPLDDRLSLVTSISTLTLVLITAIYVRITAKTLEHLREEHIAAAEPILYLTLKTVRLDPENSLRLKVENFGKGPAIRLIGQYKRRSRRSKGQWLVSPVDSLRDSIAVGSGQELSVQLSSDDIEVLPRDGTREAFLRLRFVYEDARRNVYVYRLSLTLLAVDGRMYVQPHSEKVWRIPRHERYYIFDTSPKLRPEVGRRPLFSRTLGIRSSVDSDV